MKQMFCTTACAISFTLGICVTGLPAQATEPMGPMAEVTFIDGWTMSNGNYMAAMRVALAPNWHTYWRAPGAAGIPPQFDWSASHNIENITYHWPIPDIYEQNGMRFLGYETELILPIEFTPKTADPIDIKGEVVIGVCEDVCMPHSTTFQNRFQLNMPAQNKNRITTALEAQPKRIRSARCTAEPISDGMKIAADLKVPQMRGMEMAVIEHPDPNIWVSEASTTRANGMVHIESEMVPAQAAPFFVDRSTLRITMFGEGGKGYEAFGCTGS